MSRQHTCTPRTNRSEELGLNSVTYSTGILTGYPCLDWSVKLTTRPPLGIVTSEVTHSRVTTSNTLTGTVTTKETDFIVLSTGFKEGFMLGEGVDRVGVFKPLLCPSLGLKLLKFLKH